ncbi:hypothetical protein [Streptomyces sp. NBC_01353]|uniref:hypothetical protein n=1 Tax=Streptomyces sp. NBC_01353 TaxID=2903835 RepID=UPI002E2EFDE9|nr:hypothetical protein [Streptomyces sp. NBC_01353]
MKQAVPVESPVVPPVQGPGPALPGLRARLALAVVPLLSLGVLGLIPSLVLALRRGTRGDWLAAVAFTALSVGWWFQVALTPEVTHGAQFALDVLLLFGSTLGATAHCLAVRPTARPAVQLAEQPAVESAVQPAVEPAEQPATSLVKTTGESA